MLPGARPRRNFDIVTILGSIWQSKIARPVYDIGTTLGQDRYAARGAGLLFLLCGVRRRSIHVYLVEHRTAVAMDFDMIAPTYFIYLFSFFIYYSLP
jgi:hypothetical protein